MRSTTARRAAPVASPVSSAERDVLTSYVQAGVAMDTVVQVRVDTARSAEAVQSAVSAAFEWFAVVEASCSRFDDYSEVAALARQPGVAVPVSVALLEAVAFAVEVARLTRGAFDPTIGGVQLQRGFDRLYTSGRRGGLAGLGREGTATYSDVEVNRDSRTITLHQPLLLDLGAVAKGMAVDLAARELAGFERYAIDAGGDIYVGGVGAPFRVGLLDPIGYGELLGAVSIMNRAMCTSGGYERPAGEAGEHHIVDPRTGRSPRDLASVTVIARTAIVADALATAAFVLGEIEGLKLLADQGVDGLIVTARGDVSTTHAFPELSR